METGASQETHWREELLVNTPEPLCTLVFTFLNHFKWS